MAVGVTAAVSLALTLFAFQTKWDFTVMGGGLVCAGVILIILGKIYHVFICSTCVDTTQLYKKEFGGALIAYATTVLRSRVWFPKCLYNQLIFVSEFGSVSIFNIDMNVTYIYLHEKYKSILLLNATFIAQVLLSSRLDGVVYYVSENIYYKNRSRSVQTEVPTLHTRFFISKGMNTSVNIHINISMKFCALTLLKV